MVTERHTDLLNRFPAIEDLRQRALRRLPRAICGFLETGTGANDGLARNREALRSVLMAPRPIGGKPVSSLGTTLFGRSYARAYGAAPIGMGDLIAPGFEQALGRAAARNGFVAARSVVSSASIEDDPDQAGPPWLQLYPTREFSVLGDLVARAQAAGIEVLVLTVDCPVLGRREAQRRAGFGMPNPGLKGPRFLASCLAHPSWLRATIRNKARFCPTLATYAGAPDRDSVARFIGSQMPAPFDWEDLERLRQLWPHTLVVKGVMAADDALRLVRLGVDGVWVSNHGGRQLDAAPSPLGVLADIRAAVGPDVPLLVDSGVRSGLDIVRAFARGADFVFLGRPFLYGVAALGEIGAELVADILDEDLETTLTLLGAEVIGDVKGAARDTTAHCGAEEVPSPVFEARATS